MDSKIEVQLDVELFVIILVTSNYLLKEKYL